MLRKTGSWGMAGAAGKGSKEGQGLVQLLS